MINEKFFKHPTSIVDEGANIGSGTKIWHWSHISAGAKIGSQCSFGQNTYVGNNVKIGDFVKVQNNVSIYDNVVLEDYVFCGPSMVFTNVYNPRSAIPRKHEYRKTHVKKGATIGANATIICGVTINKYAFIGAGSLVNKDVSQFALMVGVPAKQIGWMSAYGEKISIPINGSGEWICNHSKDVYKINNNQLEYTPYPGKKSV